MINIKKLLILLFLATGTLLNAQNKVMMKYGMQLDTVKLQNIRMEFLSDKMQNRDINTSAEEAAIKYFTNYFIKNRIKPGNKGSFSQNINAYQMQSAQKKFYVGNFDFKENYSYNNDIGQPALIEANDIIFAGYGIQSASYNDFENINISNKIIMIMEGGSPVNKFGICYTPERLTSFSTNYVYAQKPKAILMVRNGYEKFTQYKSNRLLFENNQITSAKPIPEITINEFLANKILSSTDKSIKQIQYEIEQSGTSNSFNIKTQVSLSGIYAYNRANSSNIIGIIEGKELKGEYVLLYTHYDQQDGGSNNASEIASVLEIARVLSKAQKEGNGPKRSVVILMLTGTEKGLYGSNFYVNNSPYPLDRNVNAICIDAFKPAHPGKKEVTYVVSDKRSLLNITPQLNDVHSYVNDLALDYNYADNVLNYFQGSDQYHFLKSGIPTVMFGVPSETGNNPELLKRTQLAFYTVWELANRVNEQAPANKAEIKTKPLTKGKKGKKR